jgi:hypothetical protein
MGRSSDAKDRDPVLVASHGGPDMAGPAFIVTKRVFAGSWEYLLDEAIFTAPPHPAWSGAALIDREGRLIGVGSLIVGDTTGSGTHLPGNMFVPIDRLKPILADLIADGRVSGPAKPWMGINTEELRGRLLVTRVSPESPAARIGIEPGDIVVASVRPARRRATCPISIARSGRSAVPGWRFHCASCTARRCGT